MPIHGVISQPAAPPAIGALEPDAVVAPANTLRVVPWLQMLPVTAGWASSDVALAAIAIAPTPRYLASFIPAS
jgi:hypothetical protein